MANTDFDGELQSLKERSLDRLLQADVFDLAAFETLLTYLDRKAERSRTDHVISKQALGILRGISEAIVSRAEYLPEVRANLAIAARSSLLLDVMIMGETLTDRTPGVPRIL
jgi:hypothetical protein